MGNKLNYQASHLGLLVLQAGRFLLLVHSHLSALLALARLQNQFQRSDNVTAVYHQNEMRPEAMFLEHY
jgi:hypothetical protein